MSLQVKCAFAVLGPSLKKTFFADRVQAKRTAHIRAFASETISAIYVFGLLLEVVAGRVTDFRAHAVAFQLLVDLTDIVLAATDPNKALIVCRQHHEAYIALYLQCGKPKLHYVFEAIRSWVLHGVLFTTFSAEREHQQPKRLMHQCYKNDHFVS